MRTSTRFSSLLLGFLLAPTVAVAQAANQQGEEMIPRELVLALLNFGPGMGGASEIRVGRLADDVPAELVPPDMRVLGSTKQFDNALIVLVAEQPPDSAIGLVEAHLLAGGWTKPQAPQYRPQRGFVSADFGVTSYQPPDMVCRGDTFATYTGTYRRSGGSLIRLSYNRGQRYSACRTREEAMVARNPYEEAPVPILRAPLGSVTKEGNNMGMSSPNTLTLGTRLGTRLKPGEVVGHYDKQLREQGWTQSAEGAVPFFAARTYRKNDDKSRTWNAVLVSMFGADSTEQEVTLRLARR